MIQFSVFNVLTYYIITLPADFQMEHMKLQTDIEPKYLTISLYQTSISRLTREKHLPHHNHILFASSFLSARILQTMVFKDQVQKE